MDVRNHCIDKERVGRAVPKIKNRLKNIYVEQVKPSFNLPMYIVCLFVGGVTS